MCMIVVDKKYGGENLLGSATNAQKNLQWPRAPWHESGIRFQQLPFSMNGKWLDLVVNMIRPNTKFDILANKAKGLVGSSWIKKR